MMNVLRTLKKRSEHLFHQVSRASWNTWIWLPIANAAQGAYGAQFWKVAEPDPEEKGLLFLSYTSERIQEFLLTLCMAAS